MYGVQEMGGGMRGVWKWVLRTRERNHRCAIRHEILDNDHTQKTTYPTR